MEEMIFVGYDYGRFTTNEGTIRDYCNVFMLQDFAGSESSDRHFSGHKAIKSRCVSPDVFKDIKVGTRVTVYYSSDAKIAFMAPVTKA